MKILGPKVSLRRHEQDVLYTGAACQAHKNLDIKAIGTVCLIQQKMLKSLRAEYENADDQVVIAAAAADARDAERARTLILMAKFADSLGEGDRSKLFRMQPSDIGRLGHQGRDEEIEHTLIRLRHYPVDHALRTAYEGRLIEEHLAFTKAKAADNAAEQELSAIRFRILNTKLANDTFRDKQFAQLITLTSKKEANTFFRSWRSSSGPDDNKADTAPEPPSV